MTTGRDHTDVHAALGVGYSEFPPIQRDRIGHGLARRLRARNLFHVFIHVDLELLPAALDDRSPAPQLGW
jgi:hypothetical protein